MAAGTQTDRTAAAWLVRMDRDDWSPQAQAGLDAWLDADIAHRVAFLRLRAAWDESGRLAALGAGGQAAALPPRGHWQSAFGNAVHGTAPGRNAIAARDGGRPRALAGMAAMVVVSLLLGIAWQHRGQPVETTYRTAIGDLRDVRLEDGSQVTLSSASVIRVRYARRERHIELDQGEAFFDVARDRQRPFVIVAGERRVRAVGTRFAVRRGDAGAGLRVVVTQGLVQLESSPGAEGNPRPSTLLPAGSMAMASGSGIVTRTGSVADAERALDWRNGFLDFHDTTLADAAAEFNRYNSRKLVVGDPAVGALRIGGHFRWSNLDAFVRLLELGFPVQAEAGAGTVVLHSR